MKRNDKGDPQTQLLFKAPEDSLAYKEAVAWASRLRQETEDEIARKTSVIAPGTLQRIESADGITEQQVATVKLWSGLPAGGHMGGLPDVRSIMSNIALLPPIGADVKRWWMEHTDRNDYDRKTPQFNFYELSLRHRSSTCETFVTLREAATAVVRALLSETPTIVEVKRLLDEERQLAAGAADTRVPLSDVIGIHNTFTARKRWLFEDKDAGTHFDVKLARSVLREAGENDYLENIGTIEDIADIRNKVKTFGIANMRACIECHNWFVVGDDSPHAYRWVDKCVVCGGYMQNSMSMGFWHESDKVPAQEALMATEQPPPRGGTDIAARLAWMYGSTREHVRTLLEDDADTTSKEGIAASIRNTTKDLVMCPQAQVCPTDCGQRQRDEGRPFPTTRDGTFANCRLYPFISASQGLSDEAREELAKTTLKKLMERDGRAEKEARRAARKAANGERSAAAKIPSEITENYPPAPAPEREAVQQAMML